MKISSLLKLFFSLLILFSVLTIVKQVSAGCSGIISCEYSNLTGSYSKYCSGSGGTCDASCNGTDIKVDSSCRWTNPPAATSTPAPSCSGNCQQNQRTGACPSGQTGWVCRTHIVPVNGSYPGCCNYSNQCADGSRSCSASQTATPAPTTPIPTPAPTTPIPFSCPAANSWCSNHGGIVLTVPYSVGSWSGCRDWCDTVMSQTNHLLCQYNADGPRNPRSCWVNSPPIGGVGTCSWSSINPPYGAVWSGYNCPRSLTFGLTPTPVPGCLCNASNACTTECVFDKFADVTYINPIKCSREGSIAGPTPSAGNKDAYCQRSLRVKGDADGSSTVDQNDYAIYLRAVLGAPIAATSNPDFNGDGIVSPTDLLIWTHAR